MRRLVAEILCIFIRIVFSQTPQPSYSCEDTGIDKIIKVTINENGATAFSKVYANGKPSCALTEVTSGLWEIEMNLNNGVDSSHYAMCGLQGDGTSATPYTGTFISQSSDLTIELGTDWQFVLSPGCDFTNAAATGSVVTFDANGLSSGFPSVTAVSAAPTVTMSILAFDSTGAAPNIVVENGGTVSMATFDLLEITFNMSLVENNIAQTGLWVGRVFMSPQTAATSAENFARGFAITDEYGCGTDAAATAGEADFIHTSESFSGLAVDSSYISTSPRISLFRFPLSDTISITAHIFYCSAANQGDCDGDRTCPHVPSKKRRDVTADAADTRMEDYVSSVFKVTLGPVPESTKTGDDPPNTFIKSAAPCLKSTAFLVVVIVLSSLLVVAIGTVIYAIAVMRRSKRRDKEHPNDLH
ncbi:unnamed protein product [Owenia fusiformis]|uniref:Uncharacterized protein n=1 Tax=Owenia fusiformis TaxID=6347 RepID=A0A8J1XMI2_OWEFU|nr:unnamed protein product [Owenia fusiformis]